MPLSLNKHATVDVWLAPDAEIHAATRPAFKYSILTSGQVAQIEDLCDQAEKVIGDTSQEHRLLNQALAVGFIGQKNLPEDFKISSGLVIKEKWQLVGRLLREAGLSEDDPKKSESPSPSPTESSAAATSLDTAL